METNDLLDLEVTAISMHPLERHYSVRRHGLFTDFPFLILNFPIPELYGAEVHELPNPNPLYSRPSECCRQFEYKGEDLLV